MKQSRFLLVVAVIVLCSLKGLATKWYVDEGSNAGDIFTPGSVAGSNANPGTPLAPFATVNFALTQAAAFDTIYVDAGIYNEQVIITKSIYIFGAGKNVSVFNGANKSTAGGTGFTINKNVQSDIRYIGITQYNLGVSHTGGVNSDTLRTLFRGCDISDNFSNGLQYFGAIQLRKFLVDSCTVSNNNGAAIARALLILGPEEDSVRVLNSLFNGNRFVGIDFNSPPTAKTNKFIAIVNNTITGCAQPGVATHGFLSGIISQNTITDCGFCALEVKTCKGNGSLSGAGSFVISKNIISRTTPSLDRRDICGIGILNRDANIAGASGTLTTQGISLIENEISNYSILGVPVVGGTFTPADIAAWAAAPYNGQIPDTLFDAVGIVIEGRNHQLLNNKFTNCEIGLLVQEIPAFSGTTAPISDFFDANRVYPGATTSVTASFSGFYGCTKNVRTVNVSSLIDMSNSFFNAFSALTIAPTLQELNGTTPLPFPVINSHFIGFSPIKPTGIIDFSPWVKNVTDPPAVGYQGDYTSLIVDHQSPNVGPRPYIQEGHDNTSGSPVLFVQIEPGPYPERNVVSKSIHYIGVNSPTLNVLQMNGVGDTLYVDSGFELKDSLYCLNGLINTVNLSTILLKETCVSDLGTPTSFVNGPLNAERLSTGSFTLNFPVGKASFGNRHAVLNLNQSNLTLTTYTAEYFSTGAPVATILPPIDVAWVPQSYWRIQDGGASNFTNPQITLNYNTNDYVAAAAHTVAKRINTPTPAWDYIKDLTPSFIATSGTVSSSAAQNFKFVQMGEFAIAPIKECPDPDFTIPLGVCLKDTLQPVNTSSIAATNTIVSYVWNFGDGSPLVSQTGTFAVPFPSSNPPGPKHVYLTAGTYTIKLVATARTGCKDSISIPVTVFNLPTGSVTPAGSLTICPNSTIVANANATASYTWGAIPALSITATSTLGITSPGKYFVRIQDANGCKATSDTLTVALGICRDLLGVSKQVVQQTNLGAGVYEVVYRIKAKNYGTAPITNIQLIEPLVTVFPTPTTYTVMGLTVLNGNFTANTLFNGNTIPNLISAPGNTLAVGDSSTLELKIQVTPNNQFTFKNEISATGTGSFGVVTDSSTVGDNPDPNGDGIPNEFGTTDITLIADFIMPGGFSPDGDGVNDVLVIQGIEQFAENEVQIFNRWGNLVYKKSKYANNEAWNAAPNVNGLVLPGNKVPTGTYYYIIKLTPNDKPLTGYITIKY